MGKRSDFARRPQDTYDTPAAAVEPLLPFLEMPTAFVEPCAGAFVLADHLRKAGHICCCAYDIVPRKAKYVHRKDAFRLTTKNLYVATHFITNPPWRRDILHPMITHLRQLIPTWLLIDANWMFTAQAVPYLRYCERIVTVGRVKWIPGTTMTGKDDAAWFLFVPERVAATHFHGKKEK